LYGTVAESENIPFTLWVFQDHLPPMGWLRHCFLL
jgi:hypothetical protein